MNKIRTALFIVAALILTAAAFGRAQGANPPQPSTAATQPEGRQRSGGKFARVGITGYYGETDARDEAGSVTTYRGNVRLWLPTAKALVRADQMIYDDSTKEFVLSGNVRLSIDTQ
jgi:lipopolysaccharide assembly outer membrane protein LptD (OstA)